MYRDGVHYVNGTLVGTPAALLRHPEALVYAPERGHLRLAALEYVVLKSAWDQAHGKNAPRGQYGHRFNIDLCAQPLRTPDVLLAACAGS